MTCWVCGQPLDGQPTVAATNVPQRLLRYAGRSVHLRCQGAWAGAPWKPPWARRQRPAADLAEGPRLLYAEDIALLRGISRRQAHRWLVRLEQQFGAAAVGRLQGARRVRRYTTAAALEVVQPRMQRQDELLDAILVRLRELEDKVTQGHARTC